jgi:hypothetical protein
MAAEVIKTVEAFFNVQRENRMKLWLLRFFSPIPAWFLLLGRMCSWPELTRKRDCGALGSF